MNAEYGAKPITCPKPVLRRRVRSSYALEPVVNFDFQWAGRHPAHHLLPTLILTVLSQLVIAKFVYS